ncbi:hypothetical protein [Sunxiuqinia dokdonensis]|uniref:Uncharacterized protein n=1 Tax=Sunxiuqinia dokdonensis TaxID=1409788 RepID=A0A0L8V882_9BACT|nr:hypothetical protein [Sunxiuqinia dokdonensis]KOH44641.1 hypothetical protein NC99_25490 [Sunxiuqinia dokdonensis]
MEKRKTDVETKIQDSLGKKMTRKEAIKKTGYAAASAATMMILLSNNATAGGGQDDGYKIGDGFKSNNANGRGGGRQGGGQGGGRHGGGRHGGGRHDGPSSSPCY